MKVIEGNILDVEHGIICHQVNCKGVMGSGLALQIKLKWPIAYKGYMNAYRHGRLILGDINSVVISENPDLFVTHMCGQYNYGRNGRYTDYDALERCLIKVHAFSMACNMPMYLPYGVGCGLAGGEWWGVVRQMIDNHAPEATVVRLK